VRNRDEVETSETPVHARVGISRGFQPARVTGSEKTLWRLTAFMVGLPCKRRGRKRSRALLPCPVREIGRLVAGPVRRSSHKDARQLNRSMALYTPCLPSEDAVDAF
jgi:hypothetical protein